MSGTGGSRVENLAEKIAAIRERRERHRDMLAELDRTARADLAHRPRQPSNGGAYACCGRLQRASRGRRRHKLIVGQQEPTRSSIWGCWHRPPNRQKRFSAWGDRGRGRPGLFISRTSRPARRLGSILRAASPAWSLGQSGLFRKDEFSYDPTSDSFLCPAGQQLHPYSSSLIRGLKKINYRNSQACRDCPIRSQCTGNQFRSCRV